MHLDPQMQHDLLVGLAFPAATMLLNILVKMVGARDTGLGLLLKTVGTDVIEFFETKEKKTDA